MSNDSAPLLVYIDESDRKDYKKLIDEKDSPLNGIGNPAIYLLAVTVGYYKGERVELDNRGDWTRVEYFDDRDLSIIKAIAVEEKDLDVLLNEKKVFCIAEEYATTGIKILKNEIYGGEYGDFIKRLESDLVEEYQNEFNT